MKKRYIILVVAIIVFILLVVSCSPAAPPAPTPTPTKDLSAGKALVENRCSTCHPVSLVQAARYNQEGWLSVTQRMVSKGTQLSPEQVNQVVEYLAATYPGQ